MKRVGPSSRVRRLVLAREAAAAGISEETGCGFPVIRFLLLFSPNSGAVLHAVTAHLTRHELRLVRQLQGELQRGDIAGSFIHLVALGGLGCRTGYSEPRRQLYRVAGFDAS